MVWLRQTRWYWTSWYPKRRNPKNKHNTHTCGRDQFQCLARIFFEILFYPVPAICPTFGCTLASTTSATGRPPTSAIAQPKGYTPFVPPAVHACLPPFTLQQAINGLPPCRNPCMLPPPDRATEAYPQIYLDRATLCAILSPWRITFTCARGSAPAQAPLRQQPLPCNACSPAKKCLRSVFLCRPFCHNRYPGTPAYCHAGIHTCPPHLRLRNKAMPPRMHRAGPLTACILPYSTASSYPILPAVRGLLKTAVTILTPRTARPSKPRSSLAMLPPYVILQPGLVLQWPSPRKHCLIRPGH